jgi:hypothetical protein
LFHAFLLRLEALLSIFLAFLSGWPRGPGGGRGAGQQLVWFIAFLFCLEALLSIFPPFFSD